jgi:signal peptidase I
VTSPESDVVATEPTGAPEATSKSNRIIRTIGEWVLILVLAMGAAFVIRSYVFQTFYIPSVSMVPTLEVGDRIIVSKISTSLGSIHRGDIIVFARPPRESCGGSDVTDLVKRVIGLPGETISSRGDQILINGKVIEQHWNVTAPLGREVGTVKIPQGQYFMMGDNRSASCDSRYWGTLPKKYVVGKVVMRIWPLSRIGHP